MGRCRAQDGLSTAQMGRALSWKDAGSHQMMMVPQCFAIWCAHRWGDTSISTTVAVIPAIIQRRSILTREWSQIPSSRKIGSHMVFTGAEWVSSLYNHATLSGSCNDQVSEVMGTTTPYCLRLIHVSFVDPYPREEQANFAKWYVVSY